MLKKSLYFFIAFVWLANGLFCKVLNIVPRHQEIVGSILGFEHDRLFTLLIGISEIVMAIWFLSKYQSKFNAITQILVVATMNVMEFILVPDLLLWGKLNSFFAFLFILIVYIYEFKLKSKK
jgi:hypothetical protein